MTSGRTVGPLATRLRTAFANTGRFVESYVAPVRIRVASVEWSSASGKFVVPKPGNVGVRRVPLSVRFDEALRDRSHGGNGGRAVHA
jgi:hypothetical protein